MMLAIAVAVTVAVVLVDIACPNDLHGPKQYRLDWIRLRNLLCDVLKAGGVSITRRCRYADNIMARFFHDPIYRREWDGA